MRDLFRRYLDLRLAVYKKLPVLQAARAELAKANELQVEIWNRAISACLETANPLAALLLPALNGMLDIASTRTAVAGIHPPAIIFVMLGVLALMSTLLAGHAMSGGQSRSWIHPIGFALMLASSVYVIFDLEFPRLGFIRVDAFDQVQIELRASMN